MAQAKIPIYEEFDGGSFIARMDDEKFESSIKDLDATAFAIDQAVQEKYKYEGLEDSDIKVEALTHTTIEEYNFKESVEYTPDAQAVNTKTIEGIKSNEHDEYDLAEHTSAIDHAVIESLPDYQTFTDAVTGVVAVDNGVITSLPPYQDIEQYTPTVNAVDNSTIEQFEKYEASYTYEESHTETETTTTETPYSYSGSTGNALSSAQTHTISLASLTIDKGGTVSMPKSATLIMALSGSSAGISVTWYVVINGVQSSSYTTTVYSTSGSVGYSLNLGLDGTTVSDGQEITGTFYMTGNTYSGSAGYTFSVSYDLTVTSTETTTKTVTETITVPANYHYISAGTALNSRVSIFGSSVYRPDTTHNALVFGDTYGFQITVPANTETVLDLYLSTDDGNFIVTTDGTYPIDDADEFALCNENGSYTATTITFTSGGASVTLTRANVTEIQYTIPISTQNNWCKYLFVGFTSLKKANISFEEGNWTTVGDYFLYYAFYGSLMESLGDDFILPQTLTTVGTYFCRSIFSHCTALKCLPDGFNIPQNITSYGTACCEWFFSSCSALQSGTKAVITFPFSATSAFDGTNFTPTSPSAGSVYYIAGNSETIVTTYSTDGSTGDYSIREDSYTGDVTASGTVSTFVDDDSTASEHYTHYLKNETSSDKSYFLRTSSGTLRLMYLSTAEYKIVGDNSKYESKDGEEYEATIGTTTTTTTTTTYELDSSVYGESLGSGGTTAIDITPDSLGGYVTFVGSVSMQWNVGAWHNVSGNIINITIPAYSIGVFSGDFRSSSVSNGWAYVTLNGERHDADSTTAQTFSWTLDNSSSASKTTYVLSFGWTVSNNCYLYCQSGITLVLQSGKIFSTIPTPAFGTALIKATFTGADTFILRDHTHRPTEPYSAYLIEESISAGSYEWTVKNDTQNEVLLACAPLNETATIDSLTATITPKTIEIYTRNYIDEGTSLTDNITTYGTLYRADTTHDAITFSSEGGFIITVPATTVAQISLYLSTNAEGESTNVVITAEYSTNEPLDTATVDVYVDDDYTASKNVVFEVTNDGTTAKDYFIRAESGLLRLMYLADVSFIAINENQRYTSEIGTTTDMPIVETTETLPTGCEKTFTVPAYADVELKGRFSQFEDYFVTTDGTVYKIDSPYDFEKDNYQTSEKSPDYSFTSNGSTVTVARADVKAVHIKIPLERASEASFCHFLFYNCTSLTTADVTFSGECTTAGEWFMAYMFYNCLVLTDLCDFNIPQSITSTGDFFLFVLFYNCQSLEYLPEAFNLPPNITGAVENRLAYNIFWKCYSLKALPDGFNIPQGITSCGTNFLGCLFEECTSLKSLPDNFQIPQGITEAGGQFCEWMFSKCTALEAGTKVALTFPFDAPNAFSGTSFTPTSAEAGSTYYIKGNSEVEQTTSVPKTLANEDKDPANFLLQDKTHHFTEPFANLLINEEITSTDEYTWTFANDTAEEVTYGYGTDGVMNVEELTATITTRTPKVATRIYLDEGTELCTGVTTYGKVYHADTTHQAIGFGEECGFKITVPSQTIAQLSLWLSTNVEGESHDVVITKDSVDGEIVGQQTVSTYVDNDETASESYTFEVTNDSEEDEHYYIHTNSGELRLKYLADVGFVVLKYNQFWVSETANKQLTVVGDSSINLPTGCGETFEIPPYATVTLRGRFNPYGENYIITTDGNGYPIDSPYDFEADNYATSTSGAGAYSFLSNGSTVSVARADVKEVRLKMPLDRASSTYFCGYLFYNCTNLTTAEVIFTGECTSVGNYFCHRMFQFCSSLVSLPDNFNIPQGITSVGTYFCAYMFYNSSLVSLPDSFNIPQGITSGGTYFCGFMFSGCSSLVSLPDNFNIPQGITSVGTYFCGYMFSGCSSLVSLPDSFNLPQGITTSSPLNFCYRMFYGSKLSEGEPVVLTFPFDAVEVFDGVEAPNITPVSPSAGTTYYLLGNSKV